MPPPRKKTLRNRIFSTSSDDSVDASGKSPRKPNRANEHTRRVSQVLSSDTSDLESAEDSASVKAGCRSRSSDCIVSDCRITQLQVSEESSNKSGRSTEFKSPSLLSKKRESKNSPKPSNSPSKDTKRKIQKVDSSNVKKRSENFVGEQKNEKSFINTQNSSKKHEKSVIFSDAPLLNASGCYKLDVNNDGKPGCKKKKKNVTTLMKKSKKCTNVSGTGSRKDHSHENEEKGNSDCSSTNASEGNATTLFTPVVVIETCNITTGAVVTNLKIQKESKNKTSNIDIENYSHVELENKTKHSEVKKADHSKNIANNYDLKTKQTVPSSNRKRIRKGNATCEDEARFTSLKQSSKLRRISSIPENVENSICTPLHETQKEAVCVPLITNSPTSESRTLNVEKKTQNKCYKLNRRLFKSENENESSASDSSVISKVSLSSSFQSSKEFFQEIATNKHTEILSVSSITVKNIQQPCLSSTKPNKPHIGYASTKVEDVSTNKHVSHSQNSSGEHSDSTDDGDWNNQSLVNSFSERKHNDTRSKHAETTSVVVTNANKSKSSENNSNTITNCTSVPSANLAQPLENVLDTTPSSINKILKDCTVRLCRIDVTHWKSTHTSSDNLNHSQSETSSCSPSEDYVQNKTMKIKDTNSLSSVQSSEKIKRHHKISKGDSRMSRDSKSQNKKSGQTNQNLQQSEELYSGSKESEDKSMRKLKSDSMISQIKGDETNLKIPTKLPVSSVHVNDDSNKKSFKIMSTKSTASSVLPIKIKKTNENLSDKNKEICKTSGIHPLKPTSSDHKIAVKGNSYKNLVKADNKIIKSSTLGLIDEVVKQNKFYESFSKPQNVTHSEVCAPSDILVPKVTNFIIPKLPSAKNTTRKPEEDDSDDDHDVLSIYADSTLFGELLDNEMAPQTDSGFRKPVEDRITKLSERPVVQHKRFSRESSYGNSNIGNKMNKNHASIIQSERPLPKAAHVPPSRLINTNCGKFQEIPNKTRKDEVVTSENSDEMLTAVCENMYNVDDNIEKESHNHNHLKGDSEQDKSKRHSNQKKAVDMNSANDDNVTVLDYELDDDSDNDQVKNNRYQVSNDYDRARPKLDVFYDHIQMDSDNITQVYASNEETVDNFIESNENNLENYVPHVDNEDVNHLSDENNLTKELYRVESVNNNIKNMKGRQYLDRGVEHTQNVSNYSPDRQIDTYEVENNLPAGQGNFFEDELLPSRVTYYNDEDENTSPTDYSNVNQVENTSPIDYNFVDQVENTSPTDYNNVNQVENTSPIDYNFVDQVENTSPTDYNNVNQVENTSPIDYNFVDQVENISRTDYNNVNQVENTSPSRYHNVNRTENYLSSKSCYSKDVSGYGMKQNNYNDHFFNEDECSGREDTLVGEEQNGRNQSEVINVSDAQFRDENSECEISDELCIENYCVDFLRTGECASKISCTFYHDVPLITVDKILKYQNFLLALRKLGYSHGFRLCLECIFLNCDKFGNHSDNSQQWNEILDKLKSWFKFPIHYTLCEIFTVLRDHLFECSNSDERVPCHSTVENLLESVVNSGVVVETWNIVKQLLRRLKLCCTGYIMTEYLKICTSSTPPDYMFCQELFETMITYAEDDELNLVLTEEIEKYFIALVEHQLVPAARELASRVPKLDIDKLFQRKPSLVKLYCHLPTPSVVFPHKPLFRQTRKIPSENLPSSSIDYSQSKINNSSNMRNQSQSLTTPSHAKMVSSQGNLQKLPPPTSIYYPLPLSSTVSSRQLVSSSHISVQNKMKLSREVPKKLLPLSTESSQTRINPLPKKLPNYSPSSSNPVERNLDNQFSSPSTSHQISSSAGSSQAYESSCLRNSKITGMSANKENPIKNMKLSLRNTQESNSSFPSWEQTLLHKNYMCLPQNVPQLQKELHSEVPSTVSQFHKSNMSKGMRHEVNDVHHTTRDDWHPSFEVDSSSQMVKEDSHLKRENGWNSDFINREKAKFDHAVRTTSDKSSELSYPNLSTENSTKGKKQISVVPSNKDSKTIHNSVPVSSEASFDKPTLDGKLRYLCHMIRCKNFGEAVQIICEKCYSSDWKRYVECTFAALRYYPKDASVFFDNVLIETGKNTSKKEYADEFLATLGVNLIWYLLGVNELGSAYHIYEVMRRCGLDTITPEIFSEKVSLAGKVLKYCELALKIENPFLAVDILQYYDMFKPDCEGWAILAAENDTETRNTICETLLENLMEKTPSKALELFMKIFSDQKDLEEPICISQYYCSIMCYLIDCNKYEEAVAFFLLDDFDPGKIPLERDCRRGLLSLALQQVERNDGFINYILESAIDRGIYPSFEKVVVPHVLIISCTWTKEEINVLIKKYFEHLKMYYVRKCSNDGVTDLTIKFETSTRYSILSEEGSVPKMIRDAFTHTRERTLVIVKNALKFIFGLRSQVSERKTELVVSRALLYDYLENRS